ncbi:hypothetical protein BDA99DRAFT_536534 [Phascolomyces articulosus]|uniref:Uncharacterized protein n=1 Tax=Phascolomyces articulosus TaxID=60185 RepID=A0AAD5PF56_9FUNG|nr:hypothetical protein BDA99DRAFT_536534 [Phascolomyces articulosus]
MTSTEACVLSYIHHATSLSDITSLQKIFYSHEHLEYGLEYICMAIDQLIKVHATRPNIRQITPKMRKRHIFSWKNILSHDVYSMTVQVVSWTEKDEKKQKHHINRSLQ